MLLIVISFGQEPDFIAAVIEPLAGTGGKILAGELGIYEKVSVSRKGDLHQPAAILRDYDQLHPSVG
jgi:hypothetical protein